MALVGAALLAFAGCLKITAVDAPSGDPSATYKVTVTLDLDDRMFEDEPLPADLEVRGTLAVRFPQEWKLVSATYTGSVSGVLTPSAVMAAHFEDNMSGYPEAEEEPGAPEWGDPYKPGYRWWAGYTGVHMSDSGGPFVVELVFDQRGATGLASLDFVSGITDPDSPEDYYADLSWWEGGIAIDRPVFTGVPVETFAPALSVLYPPVAYAAQGQELGSYGMVFDPDSDLSSVTVSFGDGVSETIELESAALGVGYWWWEHAWEAAGTYEVTVRADDGSTVVEVTHEVKVGISPFSDLSPDHEFFPAVIALYGQEALTGFPDGTFRPYDPVLRAQFAKMAVTVFGYHDAELTNVDRPSFTDVAATNDPYPFDYVEEAAEYGLVSGFADDTFRPWEPLTRIQLLRILHRSGELWLEDPPSDYVLPFGDVPDADRYYVAWAHHNGLVDGKDAVRFDPYGVATRGHVAKILHNALRAYDELPEPEETEVALLEALGLPVRE